MVAADGAAVPDSVVVVDFSLGMSGTEVDVVVGEVVRITVVVLVVPVSVDIAVLVSVIVVGLVEVVVVVVVVVDVVVVGVVVAASADAIVVVVETPSLSTDEPPMRARTGAWGIGAFRFFLLLFVLAAASPDVAGVPLLSESGSTSGRFEAARITIDEWSFWKLYKSSNRARSDESRGKFASTTDNPRTSPDMTSASREMPATVRWNEGSVSLASL